MDKKKAYQILELADNHDGYVSVEEAKAHGIAQTYLSEEEKQGLFRRVAKGLYLKRGYPLDPYFLLHYKYKKAVFSLRSALALHGLIDSDEISVNLPNNYMTKGIEGVGGLIVEGTVAKQKHTIVAELHMTYKNLGGTVQALVKVQTIGME